MYILLCMCTFLLSAHSLQKQKKKNNENILPLNYDEKG